MRFGRGRWHWYDLIFFGLAFAVVYPDVILDWVSGRTGKTYGWRHLIGLEILALGLMLVALILLMPSYPNLKWWYPLMLTAGLGLFRFIKKMLMKLIGLE